MLLGCGKLFDFAAINGLDEGVARGEMAIKGPRTNARVACNVVEAGGCAVARERLLGYLKDALAVALCIRTWLAGRRGWRKILLRHANEAESCCNRRQSPVI